MRITLYSGEDQAHLDAALHRRLQGARAAARSCWVAAGSAPAALGCRRALARAGALVGVRVLSFSELAQELLRSRGAAKTILSFERELLVGALLERSGRAPFAAPLARAIGELEAARVCPQQLAAACAHKSVAGNARLALLGSLHGEYRSLLAELQAEDRERALADAIGALARDRQLPGLPSELLLEAPAAGASAAHLALAALAEERLPTDAPARSLSVTLRRCASEREETAALLERIEQLRGAGLAPAQIAVVHRRPQRLAPALGALLERAEVPFSALHARSFGSSAIGAAALGWLRIAGGEGELEDLLAWLRHPGARVPRAALAQLEGDCLRAGVRDARGALALAGAQGLRSTPLQAPAPDWEAARAAAGRQTPVLPLLLELFVGAWAPLQGVLAREGECEAAALRAALGALERLSDLEQSLRAGAGRRSRALAERIATPARIAAVLARLRFHAPLQCGEGRSALAICDPLQLAAHRPQALLLCGMNEGIFPGPPQARSFLSEGERALLGARGIAPLAADDQLASERALFARCLAGAGGDLYISYSERAADGRALAPSLLLEQLPAGATEAQQREQGPSPCGRVASRPPAAPARELDQAGERVRSFAAALDPPGRISATELECYARCPRRWLIERALRAQELSPQAPALTEGQIAHRLLQGLFRSLEQETGEARLTPARLGRARELIAAELAAQERREGALARAPHQRSGAPAQLMLLRLRDGLFRYLELACEQQRRFSARHIELDFGRSGALPALALGEQLEISGRIDRIDVDAQGAAVVYDYKRSLRPAFAAARWAKEGTLQLALYMRAARQLLDLEVVGGLYQPLGGPDLRPRGALLAGVDLPAYRTDLLAAQELAELEQATVAAAQLAAVQLAEGLIEARPLTCSSGGCAHPGVCRQLR
ncbi:MAG TPA: PD-(D/E)XK nuclease family protein [Solirubrobacteraceae bacterium]|nr:PD-(D/E)XK nuclease family protein [Solirubrobacteraceae bacterium]